jgi:hypothetical protein
MGDIDDIEFTVDVLQRVIANEKHRLEVVNSLRRWIHQQLMNDIEPDHYRMKWMRKGISHMIHELELFGREFNAAHPNDKFSTGDMIDIAESAVLTLKSYIGETMDTDVVDPESN